LIVLEFGFGWMILVIMIAWNYDVSVIEVAVFFKRPAAE
jgi:hypothetical protein